MEIVTYRAEYFDGVKSLWREAFPDDPPWNAAELAIPAKLKSQPELLVLAVDEGDVAGSIMAGYDGHRGWIYAVAVRESHRASGLGTKLIREAEARLAALGCVKINLQVRADNAAVVAFYQGLGYSVEERISMGKRVEG
ncbi:GNAT family acetyltransferase [Denitrobaculum tricleocarpae]|uniref:GNAT family acetyltransferase n=1 Tax=Denitrobaculum tricleocarpae TaxID=2591009 RepID=A0A545TRV1_9PROT|nr:GNAT family acetyltransferase [Denitrobaculum tricleocarpae]